MTVGEPITLGKMRLGYVVLVLFIVLPVVVTLVFGNAIGGLWCERFELPEYEKELGFKLERRAWGTTGSYEALAFAWVEPQSPLARAGVRRGDVPRTYHGVGDLCSALGSASEGRPVQLELLNLDDQPDGQRTWRVVTITAGPR